MKKKLFLPILIVVAVILIAIPFIINESYKAGQGYVTVWDGADVLAFYGAALGAIGTVVLGSVTLHQNKVYKEDNDKAQQRLERINIQSNEVAIINKIIEFESDRIKRFEESADRFQEICDPQAILKAFIASNNYPVTHSDITARCTKAFMDVARTIRIDSFQRNNETPLKKAYSDLYFGSHSFIDKCNEAKAYEDDNKKQAQLRDAFFAAKEDYIIEQQNKLQKVLYGSLTLDEIRQMYNYISEDK